VEQKELHMSQAFVSGTKRSTFELTTPEGYVRVKWNGRKDLYGKKEFPRPVPFQTNSSNIHDPIKVRADGICFMTDDEWAWYDQHQHGAFTLVVQDTKPEIPEIRELSEMSDEDMVDVPGDPILDMTFTPVAEPVMEVELETPQPDEPPKKTGSFIRKRKAKS
jgi:hypothetical protein